MGSRVRGIVFIGKVAGFMAISAGVAGAQEAPEKLKAPEGAQVVLRVHAKGDQIYTCKEDVTSYTWTLKAPDAQLFDKDGKAVGKHFAGPSWEINDGSRVKGEPVANLASPDAGSIPWLLVNVIGHEGDGVLSRVTTIQRINTKGGKVPATGCDEAHASKEVRVAYEADYVFWAPK
jgi:hypothetical protein